MLQRLCRLLCNALTQPHFGYVCSAWYPNLNSRLKLKLQILQNKCIYFCLDLNNRAHIGLAEFEKINWLPINDRFEQCICSMTFKYFNNLSPLYMNGVFKPAGENTTAASTYLFKLSQPLPRYRVTRNIFLTETLDMVTWVVTSFFGWNFFFLQNLSTYTSLEP